jgi:hypothetical protein
MAKNSIRCCVVDLHYVSQLSPFRSLNYITKRSFIFLQFATKSLFAVLRMS